MPIPKPNENESKKDFLSRCMSDDTMNSEYSDNEQRMAVCQSQIKEMSAVETFDLDNVEIFSTGVWEGKGSPKGGDKIDESFLQNIVDSFNEVGNKVKPRMYLSHSADVSKQKTGEPAIGWITGLYRQGNKLFAEKIKSIPKKVFNAIQNKAYTRFSPGIWREMNINGKTHKNVLDHVALLGAELPANLDMDGLNDLYCENNFEGNITIYNNKLEATMDEGKIQELESKIDELSSVQKENDALKGEVSELREFIKKQDENVKQKEYKMFLDAQAKDGKITPHQVNLFMALAMDDNVKQFAYIENDKENKVEGQAIDIIKQIVDANEKVNFEGSSVAEEVKKEKPFSEMDNYEKGLFIDGKVKEYQKEHPEVSYGEAYVIVGDEIEEV